MKSTALKKNGYIPIKKHAGFFVFLFVVALILFFEHFNEGAFHLGDVNIGENEAKLAPFFAVENLKSNREGLADHKGDVILLNLWATWCAPCRVEMKSFETLYRRYRSQGLTILAVSIDKGPVETVRNFAEERGLSFPILIDTDGVVEKLYPSPTIPATFVIDKAGQIVTTVDGAKNWESEETFKAIEFLLRR
tara:strand:+ start:442 stop:1020 length:579 start_codon:yes stop_codon:yes gene_type:complete